MNRHLLVFAVLAASVPAANAQRVTAAKVSPDQILTVHTSIGHLTVIQLAEPVIEADRGSEAFRISWHGNKVLIEPTDVNVATNLFVWTASRLLSFELCQAGSVSQMDSVIIEPSLEPKLATMSAPPVPSPMDVLLVGRPINLSPLKQKKPGQIEIVFRDVTAVEGHLLFRYTIRNNGEHSYTSVNPSVFTLNLSSDSAFAAVGGPTQLSDKVATTVKWANGVPVEVVSAQVQSRKVDPKQETQGVVAVQLPTTPIKRLVRFYFGANGKELIAVTLVL